MTMFISLIILFSVSGILCDLFDCVREERITCGESPILKGFPETAEEFRTACTLTGTFVRCKLNVHESCGHNEGTFDEIRKTLDIVNSVCDEDSSIYKVISSNIECITPLAKKLDHMCNQWEMSVENFDLASKHEIEISNNYTREDIQDCLMPFWQASCVSIVMGLHCGPKVKEVIHDILTKVVDRYEKCTSEILEELQPLYETYEFIIEADLKVQNAFKKRK